LQPILGYKSAKSANHLHSSPLHSKTDWDIAIPISKDSVAIISLL